MASDHNILARTDKSDAKRLPTFAAVRRTGSNRPTHLVTATSKHRGLSSLGAADGTQTFFVHTGEMWRLPQQYR